MNPRKEYFAKRYQALRQQPGFLEKQAAKSRARRAADPAADKRIAERARAKGRDKRNEQTREWFAANPDKRRAYQQNRRAKLRSVAGVVSPGIFKMLLDRQRGKCACCRADLGDAKPHLDHVMPLALGGAHEDANLQLLCQPCNQAKHAKHPVDFMQSRGFLL